MTAPAEEWSEVRCPNGPQRLFMKLKLQGKSPVITGGNLMEFACQDCRRIMRGQGRVVTMVLHRYDFAGQLVETVIDPQPM